MRQEKYGLALRTAGIEDIKIGFLIRLASAEPSICKLVMAGRAIDMGNTGKYEQGTEKE